MERSSGFSGFPFNNADLAGLHINTALAMVVMFAGCLLMRSLTRQRIDPAPATSESAASEEEK